MHLCSYFVGIYTIISYKTKNMQKSLLFTLFFVVITTYFNFNLKNEY